MKLLYTNPISFCLLIITLFSVSANSLPYGLTNYSEYSNLPYDFIKSIVDFFLYQKKDPNLELYIDSGLISIYNLTNDFDFEFESWIDKQTEISFNGILSNIGGIGIYSNEVSNGAVIASPSKIKPNYFYQWVRDAAITINSLIECLQDHTDKLNSAFSEKIFIAIETYIINNYHLQRLNNRSGTWESLDGLGEPKFMPNGSTFDENWGRPQRDGPGLRVITISNYLEFLINNNIDLKHSHVFNITYIYTEILKPDLTYIMQNWNNHGFDLWEEIDSIHLFTSLTMLKALKSGIKMSETFQDYDFNLKLRYTFTALRFYILVESGFKNPNLPYLVETPSLLIKGQRSGLDIGSVLASLRAHDVDDGTDLIDIPFSVGDSAVLSTLAALINDMKYRYPINHDGGSFSRGFALGRYPEDLYDGYGITEGNPWFIATATASEFLFKLIYYLYYHNNNLIITKDQYSFYSTFVSLDPNIKANKVILPFNSQSFNETTLSLMNYADSFLEVIHKHVDGEGHMSEQFNRYNGYMAGAENLTWSYGSFWSAVRWRRKAQEAIDLL
jgi:glucoamylase